VQVQIVLPVVHGQANGADCGEFARPRFAPDPTAAICSNGALPPLSQERLHLLPDGLVRIELRKPYRDGTYAVDMDPLSLLCRLATSIPPPRRHTVHYGGVLAPASKLRPKVVPQPAPMPAGQEVPATSRPPTHSFALKRPEDIAEIIRHHVLRNIAEDTGR
jgi:hypothetical protein